MVELRGFRTRQFLFGHLRRSAEQQRLQALKMQIATEKISNRIMRRHK